MARIRPESGHNVIFAAWVERDKARHQICPATAVDRHFCFAMFWAIIWPEFSVIERDWFPVVFANERDICQAVLWPRMERYINVIVCKIFTSSGFWEQDFCHAPVWAIIWLALSVCQTRQETKGFSELYMFMKMIDSHVYPELDWFFSFLLFTFLNFYLISFVALALNLTTMKDCFSCQVKYILHEVAATGC